VRTLTEDPNFERGLDEVTNGLEPHIRKHLLEKISRENATIIIDYIQALTCESNPTDYSKQMTIVMLEHLARFHNTSAKPFKQMTHDDIITFLNRLRKSDEQDPLHHWIGTYNNNVTTIVRFFKWLQNPLGKVVVLQMRDSQKTSLYR
jgi:integrase/recombinase XerD